MAFSTRISRRAPEGRRLLATCSPRRHGRPFTAVGRGFFEDLGRGALLPLIIEPRFKLIHTYKGYI